MRLANRKYRSGTRWCVWRWTEVDPDGDGPYLTRLNIVQTPLFSIMLHWIHRPDPQPDMHDHPVSFLSIVLRGWYREQVPFGRIIDVRRIKTVKWFNFKRATDAHCIIDVKSPLITLVITGPVRREWGFYTSNEWVPWREYARKRTSLPVIGSMGPSTVFPCDL
jgi:hypothetical protein